MREIKFRAWDEDDKIMRSWEEVILSKEHGDNFYLEGYKENGAVTSFDHEQILEQYTGLKDKKGKEIYEGDVVRTKLGDIQEVRWVNQELKYGTFVAFVGYSQKPPHVMGLSVTDEIIGNIHEGEVQE